MRKSLVFLSAFLVFGAGCAAMMESYRRHVRDALTFAPNADLSGYGRIVILPLGCDGPLCNPSHATTVRDGSSMSLSRVGYDVYEYGQLEQLMVQSYATSVTQHTTTAAAPGVSVSVSGGETGGQVSFRATDPETGETVQMDMGAGEYGGHVSVSTAQTTSSTTTSTTTVTQTMPSHVTYDGLPTPARTWVLEQSGINGVITGRVVVSDPDDVTGFVEVHTFMRMGDARTGQMIWQFDWIDTAHDGLADVPEALQRTMQAFEEAHRMHMGMPSRM